MGTFIQHQLSKFIQIHLFTELVHMAFSLIRTSHQIFWWVRRNPYKIVLQINADELTLTVLVTTIDALSHFETE